jgi:hypothetical protein
MKIAIIGGGWVGCHLAHKLKSLHEITLFEKNKSIFKETSYNNQNRLHYGFHYARNYETRELCRNTFDKFIDDYGFCVGDIDKNCYCVPKNKSVIDFKTYLKIFEGFGHENIDIDLKNIEGCVNTKEKYIDFKKCSEFFLKDLRDIIKYEKITIKKLNKLSEEFDLVIDATNNNLELNKGENVFFELTTCLIYEKINESTFDSLTMVDGDLFSIYPYFDNFFTLTDVEYTPIRKFKSIKSLNKFKNKIDDNFINEKKIFFEKRVLEYYEDFMKNFKYKGYFLSTKSKIQNYSSTRYPIIRENNNIISCFTGKIQGIYIIEEYINNKIKRLSI